MRFEIMRAAERDIEEIVEYTDLNFGEAQTQEYLAGLYYSFDLLTDNPKMGLSFDSARRRYIYKSHYVYYRIEEGILKILRIRHTKLKEPQRR